MAEKHKSKYKKPENTKYKSRKDLKDYTTDDKKGSSNPFSTGDKQSNVLRKTDKEVVDTGDLSIKYNADDRLYKDIEDGEYDPKHAAKVLKKRQDKDEKDNAKNIKDKIENLTREQKERLVKEYISKKIYKLLMEQPTPEEETPTDAPADPLAAPTDPAATDPNAAAPADPTAAAPTDPTTAAPTDPAAAPADPAAPTDATAPAPSTAGGETQQTITQQFGSDLKSASNNFERIGKVIEAIDIALEQSIEQEEPKAINEFFRFLIKDLVKQRNQLFTKLKSKQNK